MDGLWAESDSCAQLHRWARIETPISATVGRVTIPAAPSFTAGRGLKQRRGDDVPRLRNSCAQLHRWARIETAEPPNSSSAANKAAPSFTAGRGLKRGLIGLR